jgi:hypothetical protein
MKFFVFICFLLPLLLHAHPGVGIVKDSKGNIFYTDLQQVWRISNGIRKVVIPNVHTHELYIDKNDNLYGQNEIYDATSEKFHHYLWVYRPTGKLDTVVGMKEAYIDPDFSLARDIHGNEYYTKQFLKNPNSEHIYRKSPDGKETIYASGHFKGVKWLHPQQSGNLLYALHNNIYKVDTNGAVQLVKEGIGSITPSFAFSKNNITLWGLWEGKNQDIYVAAFSDQAVKKIDSNGSVSVYYRSKDNWTPLHGVFDNEHRLWVLEGSDKNEVRVQLANGTLMKGTTSSRTKLSTYLLPAILLSVILLLYFVFQRRSSSTVV